MGLLYASLCLFQAAASQCASQLHVGNRMQANYLGYLMIWVSAADACCRCLVKRRKVKTILIGAGVRYEVWGMTRTQTRGSWQLLQTTDMITAHATPLMCVGNAAVAEREGGGAADRAGAEGLDAAGSKQEGGVIDRAAAREAEPQEHQHSTSPGPRQMEGVPLAGFQPVAESAGAPPPKLEQSGSQV